MLLTQTMVTKFLQVLTILACKYFEEKKENNQYDDLEALYNVVKKIKDSISSYLDDPYYYVYLPVLPYTDTMFKINSNSTYRKKFKNKILKGREK